MLWAGGDLEWVEYLTQLTPSVLLRESENGMKSFWLWDIHCERCQLMLGFVSRCMKTLTVTKLLFAEKTIGSWYVVLASNAFVRFGQQSFTFEISRDTIIVDCRLHAIGTPVSQKESVFL